MSNVSTVSPCTHRCSATTDVGMLSDNEWNACEEYFQVSFADRTPTPVFCNPLFNSDLHPKCEATVLGLEHERAHSSEIKHYNTHSEGIKQRSDRYKEMMYVLFNIGRLGLEENATGLIDRVVAVVRTDEGAQPYDQLRWAIRFSKVGLEERAIKIFNDEIATLELACRRDHWDCLDTLPKIAGGLDDSFLGKEAATKLFQSLGNIAMSCECNNIRSRLLSSVAVRAASAGLERMAIGMFNNAIRATLAIEDTVARYESLDEIKDAVDCFIWRGKKPEFNTLNYSPTWRVISSIFDHYF